MTTSTATLAPGRILVTGAAGFIGFHVSQRLLADGHRVVGVDNLSAYYDVELKRDRLRLLTEHPAFRFEQLDVADRAAVADLFDGAPFDGVVHLAAQAGVRYSVEAPEVFVESNLVGFANVLEGCRQSGAEHLVYASSSSVYGANATLPFAPEHPVDHPVSLYAATKRANELMAHAYSHLYDLPTTGVRFFTVYGPWGRPDMALFKFTRAILAGEPIEVYNQGRMRRDFTYVDDVVEGVVRLLTKPPTKEAGAQSPATSHVAPFQIHNIGNDQPVGLMEFIGALEDALGVKAEKVLKPIQPGDVPATAASAESLIHATGFRPNTPLAEGLSRFVTWYRDYYSTRGELVETAQLQNRHV